MSSSASISSWPESLATGSKMGGRSRFDPRRIEEDKKLASDIPPALPAPPRPLPKLRSISLENSSSRYCSIADSLSLNGASWFSPPSTLLLSLSSLTILSKRRIMLANEAAPIFAEGEGGNKALGPASAGLRRAC